MKNDSAVTEYLLSLPAEQADSLERIAIGRTGLDRDVTGTDIIVEAIDEYLARLERSPKSQSNTPPKASGVLFEFLFGGNETEAFGQLSEGIVVTLGNAQRLIDDATVLVEAKRFERASFLIATAEEEMGKIYILLDMCRVDLARRQDVLHHLCGCFYSHIIKHVYLDLSVNEYAGIRELSEVKRYFRVGAQKWWPSDPESGEPDMPHDMYFEREANLYVDVDSYADIWTTPGSPAMNMRFHDSFLPSPLNTARDTLAKLRAKQNLELFQTEALQIFNEAMKGLRVDERTTRAELFAAYTRAGENLELTLGVSSGDFTASELYNWPMYWIRL